MMNKTLKTYEDGSEFTVKHLAATIVAGGILAAVAGVATVKFDNWKTERWLKKNGFHPDNLKEAS